MLLPWRENSTPSFISRDRRRCCDSLGDNFGNVLSVVVASFWLQMAQSSQMIVEKLSDVEVIDTCRY